jgi:hypothetical protein
MDFATPFHVPSKIGQREAPGRYISNRKLATGKRGLTIFDGRGIM